jgi:DNA mismatch endonuclease (patch repair protein)
MPGNRTMADIFTREKRSAVMARIRSHGNRATELRLVALMREHGITGWRRRARVFGSPDFVFRAAKVAVFVDGCFWHGCPRHGTMPRGNRAFWKAKLTRNAARDREVTRALRKAGWRVVRVWECALARKRARAEKGARDDGPRRAGARGGRRPEPLKKCRMAGLFHHG